MSQEGPEVLRVGILGLDPQATEWVSWLAGRGIQAVSFGTVPALLAAGVALALVVAAPQDAARLVAEIGAAPNAPLTVLVPGAPGAHQPLVRFLGGVLDAKNEWERTFDAMVDPVVLLDREGVVRRANLALARALGRPIRHIVSTHYRDLLGTPAEGGGDPIAQSLADSCPRTGEARFARLPRVQQVTTSPYRDAKGVLQGLVVIVKDVQDLKEQQERLLRSARLADIGQLAGGVAHEINTPLASIALRAESLLRSAADPTLQAVEAFRNFPRYLQTIEDEIIRCKKIIGGLLEFSRVRAPEKRLTDLNALAEKAADLVGHQMKLKQIALRLRLDPGLSPFPADDGQLRQALIALLMNALDATPKGGQVEVETRRESAGAVTLTVADSGVGIPPEHLEKIFNPFFTTKPVGQGTGLGLAMCHGIVASHGGEVRVESQVGSGTRLTLVLPAGGPAAGPPS